jgi:hypothetical protein
MRNIWSTLIGKTESKRKQTNLSNLSADRKEIFISMLHKQDMKLSGSEYWPLRGGSTNDREFLEPTEYQRLKGDPASAVNQLYYRDLYERETGDSIRSLSQTYAFLQQLAVTGSLPLTVFSLCDLFYGANEL